jgi:hypothetical protein
MVSPHIYQKLASISWLVKLKKKYDVFQQFVFQLQRTSVKYQRQYFPPSQKNASHFAVMCVKRPEYVTLTIANINSLHYYNSAHTVTLFADSICQRAFNTQKNQLDYPNQVQVINQFKKLNDPWQFAKVETLILAAQKDMILMDADSVWHADPMVDRRKVTFLVEAYRVNQHPVEKKLADHIFKNLPWKKYTHYVTGFVSLPSQFLTMRLKQKLRSYTRKIYRAKMTFIQEPAEQDSYRRLAEEIGVSYAVQEMIPANFITTLKASDGPGNTSIVQSLYYGCANQIGH